MNINDTQDVQLNPDDIAARAYDIYEREGRVEGREMDHWLQAESELRAERAARSTGNGPLRHGDGNGTTGATAAVQPTPITRKAAPQKKTPASRGVPVAAGRG